MKKIKMLVLFLIAIVFILFPISASDIHIRFYFNDIVDGSCTLYYATESAVFTQEQSVVSEAKEDAIGSYVSFRLEGSLEDRLTGLRFDLPGGDALYCIDNITVSSAGVVKKQFAPCSFFVDENIVSQNDISGISLATAQDRVYIATSGNDPHIVLSGNICSQVRDCFSHMYLTRLGICLFIAACYVLYRKKIFYVD